MARSAASFCEAAAWSESETDSAPAACGSALAAALQKNIATIMTLDNLSVFIIQHEGVSTFGSHLMVATTQIDNPTRSNGALRLQSKVVDG